MSQRTYPVGQAQVPLDIAVNNDGPVAGLVVTAKILRPVDSAQWDFSDDTFKVPGSVVTPLLTLTESAQQEGLYVGMWDAVSIISDTDAIVIYESTATEIFIADDPVSFQAGVFSTVSSFVEPVIDATQRTMTVVCGIRSSSQGIIPTTAAVVTLKNELGVTIATANSTSANGIHRAQFPNINLAPNRAYLFYITFTFGLTTYNTVDAVKVLGVSA